MKVLHVNHSDISGGAARAANRIHCALKANNIETNMLVSRALSRDPSIIGPPNRAALLYDQVCGRIGGALVKLLKTKNPVLHSPAITPSLLLNRINKSDADIINLHWICGEVLSIADIGRIKKPVVWTFHDMWAFCGAEHYTDDLRWFEGYHKNNRPDYESGIDLNRWVWKKKSKHWRKAMQIITPSKWLAETTQKSDLMNEWPVDIIPNTIDTKTWQPVKNSIAKEKIGFSNKEHKFIAFGALGGQQDPRKGFDLLRQALKLLKQQEYKFKIIIFGQSAPKQSEDLGFPVYYSGHLTEDKDLSNLYSAADVMVVPSRQEAFGQTASEAHACGTPVVAFNATGLMDIVDHKQTGFLAKPFDPASLAEGIKWVLDNNKNEELSKNARKKAVSLWSYEVVAEQYKAIYEKVLKNER